MSPALLILLVVALAALGSVPALARRVPVGHAGVRMRAGEVEETLAPGWHLRPPGDRIVAVRLGEQEVRVRRQPVPAGDGGVVMVEARVHYRVVDAYRLLAEAGDVDAAIESVVVTVLRTHLMSRTAAGAAAEPEAVTAELPERLGHPLRGMGVEIGEYDVCLELPV